MIVKNNKNGKLYRVLGAAHNHTNEVAGDRHMVLYEGLDDNHDWYVREEAEFFEKFTILSAQDIEMTHCDDPENVSFGKRCAACGLNRGYWKDFPCLKVLQ